MDDKLLEIKDLVKIYGTKIQTKVLHEVSLDINKSEFMSIIGPSGSGKTTLLNIIGALDNATSGHIYFQNKDITKMKSDELASFRNLNLGFIFQFHHLLPEFTALENVIIPSWIKHKTPTKRKQQRAIELLEIVGLKDRINNKATDLSGGQQQRVAIARALINDPTLILADEPTGNLDSESTEQVYELLRNINKEFKTTFIIVTHDRHLAAKSDRVIEMVDGKINQDYLTASKGEELGWMWECPDYFEVNGSQILLVSPMGLLKDGNREANQAVCAFVDFQEETCSMNISAVSLLLYSVSFVNKVFTSRTTTFGL